MLSSDVCALLKLLESKPEFPDSFCNGASQADLMVCLPCTDQCEEGYYKSHHCDGTGLENTVVCLKCTVACDAGSYLEGHCDGFSTEDAVTCRTCRRACSQGQYVHNLCNGSSTVDTTECVDCQSCGEQMALRPCDGTGISDMQSCIDCMCGQGQYMSRLCSATERNPGLYMICILFLLKEVQPLLTGVLFSAECQDCKASCPAGLYMSGVSIVECF
jgi:hypothetical protein